MRGEPEVEDAEAGAEAIQQEGEEKGVEGESQEEPPKDDEEEWLKKIEEEEGFEIRHLTLLEPLENRQATNLVEAVARITTKLKYLGLPVRRLHSDRAGELTSTQLRCWCKERGIIQDIHRRGRMEVERSCGERDCRSQEGHQNPS